MYITPIATCNYSYSGRAWHPFTENGYCTLVLVMLSMITALHTYIIMHVLNGFTFLYFWMDLNVLHYTFALVYRIYCIKGVYREGGM
jgi:hypothetical protein